MKIAIIGLGPIGSILSVFLQEAGVEVIVCDVFKEKMDLIQKEGIILSGKFNKQTKFNKIFTNISDIITEQPDVIIFSVKATHLPSVLSQVEGMKENNIYVISAQNGIDTELELAQVFGKDRTMRMVINFAGNIITHSKINVTFFNNFNFLSSINNHIECTKIGIEVANLLNSVNLSTQFIKAEQLSKQVWEKTILNSSLSALCGITRFTMKEAMDSPETCEIVEKIILESVDVAKANGILFENTFVSDCMKYLKVTGNHMPSLAVDFLANRETEIKYFNGKIVEYGKKYSIPTPLNMVFYNIVKAVTYQNLKQV